MAKKAATKKENELATQAAPAPAFLQKAAGEVAMGVDSASKYQTINRIGIVQPQSGKERRDEFGVGSSVMFPDGVLVADKGEEFAVIPLLFYATWEQWSDYKDDDSPTVIETSYDENSDLARRTKTKATRTEHYGDPDNGYKYSYVESLNVAVIVDSGEAKGEIAILSFNKSQHFVGRKFATMIRRAKCDIFGRRVSLTITDETDGKNDWHGYALNNPSEEMGGVWITEDQYEPLKAMHEETQAAYDSRSIVINREEESTSGAAAGGFESDDLPPV